MKAFKLTMMAAMLAFASSAMAQKVVFSADDVVLGDDGTAEITVNMEYSTSETVVGYNVSLALPEGIKGANAKTGKVTGSGKVTAASIKLGSDIHPLVWDADEEDYTKDPKDALTVQDKADGNVLIIWIDQKMKTPLLGTNGQLMTIKIIGDEGASGEGKLYDISLTSDKNESLDLNNIADDTFNIGGTTGINDINAVDASAPAYNLQGVRVNDAAKGLIIRDGKKMIVK